MPEWLRGQTRILMGSARVGSHPAANDAWLDGRAVQDASFRHWSLRRRGFESHSNHFSSVLALKTVCFRKKMDQPLCHPVDMVGWPSGLRR